MFNWIAIETLQYLEWFDYVQMNEVLNSNTWKHFTVCKQMINIE